ncbi:MAG: GTP cyclohydrolase I FolE [Flavobacteriales bacterium]
MTLQQMQAAEALGDAHVGTSADTPLRSDAFDVTDEEKIARIEPLFAEIMDIIGLDRSDDSLAGTPRRVAKMYIQEIFKGLNPANHPHVKTFDNSYGYGDLLLERNINLNSTCEHHFLPIHGVAHVAYKSSGRVVGLSKINRLVDFYAKRPQVQERLTRQIAEALKTLLNTEHVAVVIDAKHMCVSSRGIEDQSSSTVTVDFHGDFKKKEVRQELLSHIHGA